MIEINNISYVIFTQVMKYLYSGKFELGPQISHCLHMYHQELEKQNERSISESSTNMPDKQAIVWLN